MLSTALEQLRRIRVSSHAYPYSRMSQEVRNCIADEYVQYLSELLASKDGRRLAHFVVAEQLTTPHETWCSGGRGLIEYQLYYGDFDANDLLRFYGGRIESTKAGKRLLRSKVLGFEKIGDCHIEVVIPSIGDFITKASRPVMGLT